MRTRNVPVVCAVVGLMALAAPLDAGEPRMGDEVVAKVNSVSITRDDVSLMRRRLTIANPELALNNRQVLDYLINCVLWNRYIDRQALRPSGSELQRAIQWLDAQLREQGSSYQKSLAALGLAPEEDAANLSFELAMQRLADRTLPDLPEQEVRAEFDARPDWYDGTRIRISGIFLDTRDFANNPEKLEKAKQHIEKIHEHLRNGKDFHRFARDYSDGPASAAGGELSWFLRNGKPVDERLVVPAPAWPFEGPKRRPRALEIPREPPTKEVGPIVSGIETPRRVRVEPLEEALVAAAWGLKVGEFTRPVQTARGWHILKVTEREGAHFTFLGARAAVSNALVRRRIEGILEKLRAAAKIEIHL